MSGPKPTGARVRLMVWVFADVLEGEDDEDVRQRVDAAINELPNVETETSAVDEDQDGVDA